MGDHHIAIIFDMDDTLVPDTTSLFLESKGLDVEDFWKNKVGALLQKGFEPTHAFLNGFLSIIGDGKPLGKLTIKELKQFGEEIDKKFFPGIPKVLDILRNFVRGYEDIDIEYFIISGGLEHIMEGSEIIKKYFKHFYGSQLEEGEDGFLKYIRRAITFTEKTRYLFEINKGITPNQTLKEPYAVNKKKQYDERRIPFENMIYVGDGRSDVPAFSLVKKGPADARGKAGIPIGISNDSGNEVRSLNSLLESMKYLTDERVIGVYSPNYQEGSDLFKVLKGAVGNRCSNIEFDRRAGIR